MRVKFITGVSVLALMLGAAPVLSQSQQDSQRDRQSQGALQPQQNQGASQPQQNERGTRGDQAQQSNSQSQQNAQQQPQSSGSGNQQPAQGQQQGVQNVPGNAGQTQQRGAQQNAPANSQAQQPAPTNQQNAQQPAQQNQQGAQNVPANAGQGQQQGAPSQQTTQAPPQQPMQQRVTLNTQQQTKVSHAISGLGVRPLSNVNFSLRFGTAVPASVRLERLPTEVVEILPQYRGYDFVLVSDQIVIIDPSTRQIVTTLAYDASSARAETAPNQNRRAAKFTDEQRAAIRKSVPVQSSGAASRRAREHTRVTVGEEVPSSVEFESFPETVYREVPTAREYRYFRNDANVVVVDPGERRVIDVIE